MTSHPEPTPQERLAASRQAILRLMTARGEHHAGPREQTFLDDSPGTPTADSGPGTWQTIRRAMRVWWYNHPAQLALELGKPVLGKYAQAKPFQLLGISAIAGAAIVLLKPWRIVPVTGLAVGAVKHLNISGFLLSLMTTPPHSPTSKEHD